MTAPASPPLTREQIAELRRLHEEATPGKWEPCLGSGGCLCTAIRSNAMPEGLIADFQPDYFLREEYEHRKSHVPDLDLACAARNALPSLLLAAEWAEGLARALEYALSEESGFACPASTEERLRAALTAYRTKETK